VLEPDDARRPGRGFVLIYIEALRWPAQRNLYRKLTADNLYYVILMTIHFVPQHDRAASNEFCELSRRACLIQQTGIRAVRPHADLQDSPNILTRTIKLLATSRSA